MSDNLRCNDREKAAGRSIYVTCLECCAGPCKLSTPTQIAPASDEEIELLDGIAPTSVVASLIARIRAEREQTIRECIMAVQDYGLKFIDHPDFSDALYALHALLTNKGEQP